jgi:hypothetical protein
VAYTVPWGPPSRVTIGSTWEWKQKQDPRFLTSDGYTYELHLAGEVTLADIAPSSTSGGEVEFSIAIATTANAREGLYRGLLCATKAGKRHDVQRFRVKVEANPDAANTDRRTYYEKLLAAIRALLNPTSTGISEVEEYSIHGRSIKKMSRERLLVEERRVAAYVLMEQNGGRLPVIEVSGFGRP